MDGPEHHLGRISCTLGYLGPRPPHPFLFHSLHPFLFHLSTPSSSIPPTHPSTPSSSIPPTHPSTPSSTTPPPLYPILFHSPHPTPLPFPLPPPPPLYPILFPLPTTHIQSFPQLITHSSTPSITFSLHPPYTLFHN
ncbi:hypothetical protein Pcinc_035766 [Petrolisthes cinctipes]|uniref:Uncharacterized protein n=1 Tax=Petrolisthes cinctipes TaxID=88211 RepID=A0AAE1EMZ6_PETCI|nr:hypothetical protein Pcinc_035766 [Petrolisthes cinctipes]